MTHLSIMVIIGATRTAAEAAAPKSDTNLHPRFFVFHMRWPGRGPTAFSEVGVGCVAGSRPADTPGCFMMAAALYCSRFSTFEETAYDGGRLE